MKTQRILFIGNSHTYFNHMPLMLLRLTEASQRGTSLIVEQCTGKGVSLEWHWKNEKTRDLLSQKAWDYVVLQERSGGTLEAAESFRQHAKLLDGAIRKAGAKTIFYMTWANWSHPETQKKVTQAYINISKELDALLAPVGQAWEKVMKKNSSIHLHHDDGRHANPTGSYLAACVFYTLLTKASPEGMPESLSFGEKRLVSIEKETALFLQRIAFETVMDYDVVYKGYE